MTHPIRSESNRPLDTTGTLPPMPRLPVRLRSALRSLRALLRDPDDTAKAIDVVYAIGGNGFERHFQRVIHSAAGRRLLTDRPSLASALSDRAALERLAPGSLGRAYLTYLDRAGFEPLGLVELAHRVAERWQREAGFPVPDPARAYLADRTLLIHDLFHVLTGYDVDDVGEATLLAFSQAQLPSRAQALLTFGATTRLLAARGVAGLRDSIAAWRRGRRATWLLAQPWEELLPLPLETVRTVLGVGDADDAHPSGVPHGRIVPRGAASH